MVETIVRATTPDRKVVYSAVVLGCDPEFFFEKGRKVIGSEKVLQEDVKALRGSGVLHDYYLSSIVRDGVQAELNPAPNNCRANLGNEIAAIFRTLKKHLATMDGVKASFSQVIEVEKEELEGLSEKSKTFGCLPSSNFYQGEKATVSVDASTYLKRSAGGHIHLGLGQDVFPARERLAPLLDALLGNTCVLIDRDPGNVERRKHYGRAGEYRLPKHGFEYRTLSNFWLRSQPLMSFVTGMARVANCVLSTTVKGALVWGDPGSTYHFESWDAEGDLLRRIDLEKVERAINLNDLSLAKENFKEVRSFIEERIPNTFMTGLYPSVLEKFDYFCKRIEEEGIQAWFPQDPLEHWCNSGEGHSSGWESFLSTIVIPKEEAKG